MRIGVALSGGGHRASLWSAGALIGLVDADANRHVVSIASVSGGSITNGVVATNVEYTTTTSDELEEALHDAVDIWARQGLFFAGAETNRFVATTLGLAAALIGLLAAAVLALVSVGRNWSVQAALIAAAATLLLAIAAGTNAATKVPKPIRASILLGAASAGPLTLAALLVTRTAHSLWTIAIVAAAIIIPSLAAVGVAKLFAQRSRKVDNALAATLLRRPSTTSTKPTPALLAESKRKVNHVFCATNLATADHLYFTPAVVYANNLGTGTPNAKLRLSTAVQASACLPAAFAPRALRSSDLAPGLSDTTVTLTDGGVYDNMADQWELGFRNREKRFGHLTPSPLAGQPQAADNLIVVNASKAFTHQPIKGTGPLAGIQALLRCKDVLYDVGTSVRRRYLVDTFKAGANGELRLGGVLVHISQTPLRLPEAVEEARDQSQPPAAGTIEDRATNALRFLTELHAAEPTNWECRAAENASVKTTLAAVGDDTAANLLHHAYVLARINTYVATGIGSVPAKNADHTEVLKEWGRDRFSALVDNAALAQTT